MCSFRLNKWFSIQPENYWPLQVQPRSLWLSFHVRRTRGHSRRLLNAGIAIYLLLGQPRLTFLVTAPSKLAPITILAEMLLGVPKFSGILGELGAPLSSF